MPKRRRSTQADAEYWRDVAELIQKMRELDRRIDVSIRHADELLRRLEARYGAPA